MTHPIQPLEKENKIVLKPHICTVCNGTGLVSVPPGVAGDQRTFVSTSAGLWPCRVCREAGVLWKEEEGK